MKAIFLIVSSVLGVGFLSGKEIAVFFARFGKCAYLGLTIFFVIFWFFVDLFMKNDKKVMFFLEKNKILKILALFVMLVYSMAMIAGGVETFSSHLAKGTIFCLLFLLSLLAFKGINFRFFAFSLPIFITIFVGKTIFIPSSQTICNDSYLSIFYGVLYAFLCLSSSFLSIVEAGKNLTKKQKTGVSFASSALLFVIMLCLCRVLIGSAYLSDSMPFLLIFGEKFHYFMIFTILIGCFSALNSLVKSSCLLLRNFCKNEFFVFFLCVLTPCIGAILGYGKLVSILYPLVGAGGCLFVLLLVIFLFKKPDKKIHGTCENA